MAKKKSKEDFIKEAIKIHGDEYDYSNIVYVNTHTHVTITCKKCGNTFQQTPHSHLQGAKCPFCSHRSFKYSVDEVKEIINNKYNNFYNTGLITYYNNNKQKLPLICPKHGYFESCLNDLNNDHACQKCGKEKNHSSTRKSLEQFINESVETHGNKYDYSNAEYINANTKICIICPEHGEFWQTPNEHLRGKGCPCCNESKLERETWLFLNDLSVESKRGKHFKWLGQKHLDFYLPKYNAAIECQGEQHFKPINFFGKDAGFEKRRKSDIVKKRLCEENNVKLFYYSKEKYEELIGKKIYHDLNEIFDAINANKEADED